MQTHAQKRLETCIRQCHNLTGLVQTQTTSSQSACNQITYRQEVKQLINTSQYCTRIGYVTVSCGPLVARLLPASVLSFECSRVSSSRGLAESFSLAERGWCCLCSLQTITYRRTLYSPPLHHVPTTCQFIHDNNTLLGTLLPQKKHYGNVRLTLTSLRTGKKSALQRISYKRCNKNMLWHSHDELPHDTANQDQLQYVG